MNHLDFLDPLQTLKTINGEIVNTNIGTDYLSIHLLKSDKQTLKDLKEIMENEIPKIEFPILDDILKEMKSKIPVFDDKAKMESWYIGLFKDQGFRLLDLVKKDENGNEDLSGVVEHIAFLDSLINVFKTRKQAGEYIKIDFLSKATTAQKAKVAEEDRKYKPEYKERERIDKEKLTAQEKQIRKLTGLGMTREDAEKLILGSECGKCHFRICKCDKESKENGNSNPAPSGADHASS